MSKFLAFVVILAASGSLSAAECINHDLVAAKLVLDDRAEDAYRPAYEYLKSIAENDTTGETHFYAGALANRLGDTNSALGNIQESASRNYHFANAFLGYAHESGYLEVLKDLEKSKTYYQKYRESVKNCDEFSGTDITDDLSHGVLFRIFLIQEGHNKSMQPMPAATAD